MEDRISDLEIKLNYAEHQIDELNLTVFRQQQEIALLQNDLRALRQQVASSLPSDPAAPQHEIPPHY